MPFQLPRRTHQILCVRLSIRYKNMEWVRHFQPRMSKLFRFRKWLPTVWYSFNRETNAYRLILLKRYTGILIRRLCFIFHSFNYLNQVLLFGWLTLSSAASVLNALLVIPSPCFFHGKLEVRLSIKSNFRLWIRGKIIIFFGYFLWFWKAANN